MAKVRLQNLRNFTVQIRRPSDDAIIGTGIAVSMDGKVVTCAHVVEAALGVHPREANGAEIGVYFPQVRGGEKKERRAQISACFQQHDDDVVLLQLLGGASPLAPEQIAILGTAEESCYHPFRSYGYRRLEKYIAGHAHGTILDCVEAPEGYNVQAEPVQLESNQINRGMSGSAVLDVERNLVVGIVSETWFSGESFKDRDTAWAVNARVLSLEPLGLPMQDEPLPKRDAPQPKTDIEAARNAVAPELVFVWNNAPPPLKEWVGREDLLQAISGDWKNPDCRVTGLIGFGGEGKSSLARKWVEELLSPTLSPSPNPSHQGAGGGGSPDGIFWWGFYTKPNVEEFFEAALVYLSGGRIDPRRLPSANTKAQVIGAMLGAGHYLFVLDGLEILQHQEGDQYGLLKSNDLREFLSYFADPKQQSFCLITSRAPVLDLMEYTTYTHHDVTRLSPADGRALLDKVGVQGDDAALDKIVADWDGHALTLSLLGAYLVDQHEGDATQINEIPPPTADEERYARVHRVLRRYDEHLTEAERAFLTLFSAFRTPVEESAFEKVFRGWGSIAVLNETAFAAMLQRLLTYRILHYDPNAKHYTTHPLIRAHYFAQLTAGDRTQAQKTHEAIKDYYLELAGDTPYNPSLDDLKPLIEVIHHACRAGAYDEAINILWERIYQSNNQSDRRVLVNQLGAWETALALMQEFFSNRDTSQEPQVSSPGDKSWILNEVGLCLMYLGDLSQAVPFYERMIAGYLAEENLGYVGRGYQNLAELHVYLGALTESAAAAREALRFARRAENREYECDSLSYQALVARLQGDLNEAKKIFQKAELLEKEKEKEKGNDYLYLYSIRGIFHADHLRRTGDANYARHVTEANLEICERNRWANQISWCHRVLGDLDALKLPESGRLRESSLSESAHGHYDEALKIACSISHRPTLIEALLARGRFFARFTPETPAAFSDLRESLDYALNGGYRIYEADIRIALAWAHLSALRLPESARLRESSLNAARAEAQRALQMSTEMGYYWGKIDAEEVLEELQEKISR